MNPASCPSCGASNSPELIYCSQCGALLERTAASGSGSPAASLAKRRSLRIEADRPPAPGLLSRIKDLVIYLFWVAVGVTVVLASKDPGNNGYHEQPVPDAEGVMQRALAASHYTSSVLTQPVINTVLSKRGSFAPESPVRLLPMPAWDQARVELYQGSAVLHVTVSLFGVPFRLAETFRLQGGPGEWSLKPEFATVGLLRLPDRLVPAVTPLIRPGFLSLSKDIEFFQGARSIVIHPGFVEVTGR